jgi:gamma-glutamylcyclotransferase (GGCT)/AIG2-like uncharacterized protein YtfP
MARQQSRSHALFAYGTLMDEDIMHRVSGFRLKGETATIRGYRRYGIVDAAYPGIIVAEGQSVTGVVYHQVPKAAWKRLDDFEGDMYSRLPCELREFPGIAVDVYVLRSAYHHLLAQHEWSFKEFLRLHKRAYL